MTTYIALLRGINVSGQKKVPMADLRLLIEQLGFHKVQTYIQSGNVVFQTAETNQLVIEESIQKKLFDHFGFEVSVLVRTFKQMKSIVKNSPFSNEILEKSYFTLLHQVPNSVLVQEVETIQYPKETFHIKDDCVYFYSSTGYGNAKCNNNFFERKLKITATTRNYKTMLKLLSLCSEDSL